MWMSQGRKGARLKASKKEARLSSRGSERESESSSESGFVEMGSPSTGESLEKGLQATSID